MAWRRTGQRNMKLCNITSKVCPLSYENANCYIAKVSNQYTTLHITVKHSYSISYYISLDSHMWVWLHYCMPMDIRDRVVSCVSSQRLLVHNVKLASRLSPLASRLSRRDLACRVSDLRFSEVRGRSSDGKSPRRTSHPTANGSRHYPTEHRAILDPDADPSPQRHARHHVPQWHHVPMASRTNSIA